MEVHFMPKIFAIEDDDGIIELLSCALKTAGMDFCGFETYSQFIEVAKNEKPDLILLDIMLPQMDGILVLKKLKQNTNLSAIPVIMLTAKNKESDKVTGLDLGAEDYISKPFGVFELIARIKAVLRRNNESNIGKIEDNIFNMSGITLDIGKHLVTIDNKNVQLTYKEFELLKFLMQNKNIVLSRENLLDKVWGYDYSGGTRTVDMHIKSLRQKLGDDIANPRLIATIRGLGYKFICLEN
jgi:two-component system alkaline phosphatase synthesis response regulator PhoP